MKTEGSQRPVALVTGGSRGIGRAISERLARDGYSVVINFLQNGEAAESVRLAVEGAGSDALVWQADVSLADQVQRMFGEVERKYGRLDLLVNNAGKSHSALVAVTPPDRFLSLFQANLMSTLLCSQAALRIMVRQRRGVIINVSSASAMNAPVGVGAYAASKAAVSTLTRVLAKEVASWGIRVNAVAPTWVRTDMLRGLEEAIADGVKRLPLRRVAEPEEVASVVSALAREDMTYVSGQVITVDGGGR